MIGTSRHVGVWAHSQPTDLRKGFDGLAGLVERELGQDVVAGDLYLFVNRRRTMAKVLAWDGTGLCIYSKRLEGGRFACPWRDASSPSLRLTMSELQLFLEGSQLVGRVDLSPPCRGRERVCFAGKL